jgi:phosphoglycerate dehydrogenase-like enzyme
VKIAAFFGDPIQIDRVYGPKEQTDLRKDCCFIEPVINRQNFDAHLEALSRVEVIFSTWTMPRLERHHLDRMPALRAVFFAAGSVKYFAEPLLKRDILVVSASKVNAIPTSEFAFAQIILSMKGGFRNQREYRSPEDFHTAFRGPGNCDESVALLGMGSIGSRVAELLKMLNVKVLAYDPHLSEERAAALGVEQVILQDAFSRALVVSNHIPHLPETEGILTAELFASMRANATFINTARGCIIDEPGMISILAKRPDVQALLDVTYPEPPQRDSLLFTLPNVYLTGHIAGAINNETRMLARACIREFQAWKDGLPLKHSVTLEGLALMA